MPTEITDGRLQEAVDAVPPCEEIVADPTVQHVLDEPLVVATPDVTVRGLNLRLADDADEDLIEIGADGVTLTGFALDGNREHQHGDRQSSGVVATGVARLTLSEGYVRDVSRHGLRIVDASDPTSLAPEDTIRVDRGPVRDVTVRDVRIDSPRRDGCSIEGPDLEGAYVENVRTFGSSDRGSVEVKDGASDAIVSNCYAEDCVYGVAVQDHGEYPTENVRIVGNTARNCATLVDAQTSHPPENVAVVGNTGRGLTADGMGGPGGIHLHRIEGVVVSNNVLDGVDGTGLSVRDCEEVIVSGNVLRDVETTGIEVRASTGVSVGDNGIGADEAAIACVGGESGTRDVQITDNRASGGGLVLDGDVDRYVATGNLLARPVSDGATGDGLVANNLG